MKAYKNKNISSSSSSIVIKPKKKTLDSSKSKDSSSDSSEEKDSSSDSSKEKDSSSDSSNISTTKKENILSQLNKIATYYEKSEEDRDKYKAGAFRNGIKIFSKYNGDIIRSELKKASLGPHTIDEIMEIYNTSKSKRLALLIKEYGDIDEKEIAIRELSSIKYIKEETAKKLYNLGFRSLKDLKKGLKNNKVKLTDAQILGVKYYDDLKERIPRPEMNKWNKIFTKLLDEDFKWDLVGSYRRGMPSSSDLDLIITNRKNKDVVKILKKKGYLVDEITNGTHSSIVLIRLDDKSKVRQLDITNFSEEEYIYGLLHTTGSDEHVKKMQKRAKEMGYKILNTYGLYTKKDKSIIVNSEEEIFELLDLEYQPPNKRDNKIIIKED